MIELAEVHMKVMTNVGVTGHHPVTAPSAALRLAATGDSSSSGRHTLDQRPTSMRLGCGSKGCERRRQCAVRAST